MGTTELTIGDNSHEIEYDTYDCNHHSTNTMDHTCPTVEWLCDSTHGNQESKIEDIVTDLTVFINDIIDDNRVEDKQHNYSHKIADMLKEQIAEYIRDEVQSELDDMNSNEVFGLQDEFKENITYQWRSAHGHSIGYAYEEGFINGVDASESYIKDNQDEIIESVLDDDNDFQELIELLTEEQHERLLNALFEPYDDEDKSGERAINDMLIRPTLVKAQLIKERYEELCERKGDNFVPSMFPYKVPVTISDWVDTAKNARVSKNDKTGKVLIETTGYGKGVLFR